MHPEMPFRWTRDTHWVVSPDAFPGGQQRWATKTAVLSSTNTRRRGDQWRTKLYVNGLGGIRFFEKNKKPPPPYFFRGRDDLWWCVRVFEHHQKLQWPQASQKHVSGAENLFYRHCWTRCELLSIFRTSSITQKALRSEVHKRCHRQVPCWHQPWWLTSMLLLAALLLSRLQVGRRSPMAWGPSVFWCPQSSTNFPATHRKWSLGKTPHPSVPCGRSLRRS